MPAIAGDESPFEGAFGGEGILQDKGLWTDAGSSRVSSELSFTEEG